MSAVRFTEEQMAQARARFDVIAADIALRRKGRELVGLCCFHNEKTPSFTVAPDKGLWKCFGCGLGGSAIDFVMQRRGLAFLDAVRELLDLPPQRAREAAPAPRNADADGDQDRTEELRKILAGCGPITPTTAAHLYLWSRGLDTRQPGLLAHPALECWELGRDEHGDVRTLPALVAPVTNSAEEVTAALRIWVQPRLEYGGAGPAPVDARAPLRTRKKGIGTLGDGAVRLVPLDRLGTTLALAEGVETAAACRALYRFPTWAASGTARFGFPAHWRQRQTPAGERPVLWIPPDRPPHGADTVWVEERAPSIWLPDHVENVIVFGDRGFAGETVARHAADWWNRQGRDAVVILPDEPFGDFNETLLAAS